MIYCMSDLHGQYDQYRAMLKKIQLKDSDILYILGDFVDRGKNGLKIILDACTRENIVALKGNHDYVAEYFLREVERNLDDIDALLGRMSMWLNDGGMSTLMEYIDLSEEERHLVMMYFMNMAYAEDIIVGDTNFLLAHTVPEPEKIVDVEEVELTDFLEPRADYKRQYFEETVIVTGHTPTVFIEPEYKGRIWKGNNHIALDCGAVFGEKLGCICLDTMEEFYV